jgi:hypothetical protein
VLQIDRACGRADRRRGRSCAEAFRHRAFRKRELYLSHAVKTPAGAARRTPVA